MMRTELEIERKYLIRMPDAEQLAAMPGCVVWDVIFGSLATLLGAVGTRLLRKNRWLACLPPILANTVIVPFVLVYAYGVPEGIPYLMLTVGVGEVISCGILGQLVYSALDKHRNTLFK